MERKPLTALSGFLLLFLLYHAAEYMIVFQNSAAGFLSFQLLFFIAAWGIAKWQLGTGMSAWGLGTDKGFLKQLGLGIVMGTLLYGTTFIVSLLLRIEKITAVPSFASMIAPLGLFIFGNFFSSFSEDVLTRGYVYRYCNGHVRKWVIVVLSAAIYLLNHIYRLNDGIETYSYLFLLGVLLALPLVMTQRLWYTGGMHWMGNGTFYLTHEVINTDEAGKGISANLIFMGAILLFIPLHYYIGKKVKLLKPTERSNRQEEERTLERKGSYSLR